MNKQTYEAFTYQCDGPIAEVRLSQPDRRNALSASFWEDFPRVLREMDENACVRALILSAEGKSFSAGMDLAFFARVFARENEDPGRYREWVRREIVRLQQAISLLEEVRVPVIAVVQGACIGAGLDLVCATDLRICTAEAYFSIHEINIGMTADLGTLQRLPKSMPPALVNKLAYTGCRLNASEAKAVGFVCDVHADLDAAIRQAHELAGQISEKSPLAIAGTKVALRHARDHSVPDSLQQIAAWNAAMFISEDLRLGMEAQRNKATARYRDILGE
jgi:enoyl-CoA hydratase/carnithine racemase